MYNHCQQSVLSPASCIINFISSSSSITLHIITATAACNHFAADCSRQANSFWIRRTLLVSFHKSKITSLTPPDQKIDSQAALDAGVGWEWESTSIVDLRNGNVLTCSVTINYIYLLNEKYLRSPYVSSEQPKRKTSYIHIILARALAFESYST